jgi:hypothetical protein
VTLRIAPQLPPKNKIKPSEPCGQKAAFKGQGIAVSPVVKQEGETPGEAKERIAQVTRTLFRDLRVTRYVQVAESWTLSESAPSRIALPRRIGKGAID